MKWKAAIFLSLATGLLGYLSGAYFGGIDDRQHEATLPALEPIVEQRMASQYICPMHAVTLTDAPGKCPICGMELVNYESDVPQKGSDGNAWPVVKIAPVVVHNLGVRTAVVKKGDLQHSIETIGKITRVDPMARRTLTPPIRGELVYIADKHDADLVTAGELLFSVKSDELFEYERAFQDTYRSGDRATANAMVPQLRAMGLTPDQIARLQAGESPEMAVEVHAFENGFIYTRRGHVGLKVNKGVTIFNVGGNYRVIEVTAEIFERQWGWVEQGQRATMTVRGLPGTEFEGEVVRVEPPVGYTTRSLEVAIKFKTDDPQLTQSMFAHVSIAGQPRKDVLMVPTDTVIRTGEGDRVVLARSDNRFQPVPVVAGEEAGGMIEIRSGLQAGDRVVASGQFLIDSESSLLAGFRRLAMPGTDTPDSPHPHQHAETRQPQQPPASDNLLHLEHDAAPGTQTHTPDGYQPVSYTPESHI
jgi:Cu(I)/Ag(I) efflux system membrane fusion protein